MYVVCTAFIPHKNNDLTKEGKTVPIACIRCGDLFEAEKDSFTRVYQEDGTFKYPRIDENQKRVKGKLYFKPMDLTGSSEGTAKKPKCSLLKFYQDQIIPALEEKVVQQLSENGKVKVVIVKQEDNAGLHNDKTYLYHINEEFRKRDWIIFNEPPLSPALNVHDSCIFPMLSKKVSSESVVLFGSRVLVGEELHQTIMKVWKDHTNLAAIARAFIQHTQIASSVLYYEGGNDYLYKKGGLHFGIRRTFLNDADGQGVTMVDLAPENKLETNAGNAMHDRAQRGLRNHVPDLRPLYKNAKLSQAMLHVLRPNIEHELMDDDLLEVWFRIEQDRA